MNLLKHKLLVRTPLPFPQHQDGDMVTHRVFALYKGEYQYSYPCVETQHPDGNIEIVMGNSESLETDS